MALTIHRYSINESYILDSSLHKVKIVFEKADEFHKETIRLTGDSDISNIILDFFDKDDNYGTRLGIKQEIMELLKKTESDFDFLTLADNGRGVDTEIFYKPAYIADILQSIEDNKELLIENFWFKHPQCMTGISEALAFARKAEQKGDLMLFWFQ